MGLKDLIHMIFGTGDTIPKNPKLTRREAPTKHWGSKKRFNKTKARQKDRRARASRKRNRVR